MNNKEEMALQACMAEVEALRRNSFTDLQIEFIFQSRKELDNSNSGQEASDYIACIEFEKMVLKLVRMKNLQSKNNTKRSDSEYLILLRIKKLYNAAVSKFSNNFDLHVQYFKFCQQFNFQSSVPFALMHLIRNFGNQVEVWKISSDWYAYEKKDLNEAIKLLHLGLMRHPEAEELYSEAIMLELMNIKFDGSIVKTPFQIAGEKIACKQLTNYLKLIFVNIKNQEFYIKILQLLEKHDFTKELQDMIIKKLITMFKEDDTIWHLLAQREFEGYHYNCQEPKNTTKFRVLQCIKKYEEGLKFVPMPKKINLWENYLDCLIKMHEEDATKGEVKGKQLIDVCQRASEDNALNDKHYIAWIELVTSDKDLEKILLIATTKHNKCAKLWLLRLKHAMRKLNTHEVKAIFETCVDTLEEPCPILWIMVINFHLLMSEIETVDELFAKGIKRDKEVALALKPLYLEWIVLASKDIMLARKKYNELFCAQPHSKKLHEVMAWYEMNEIDVEMETIEAIHINACEQFGSEDVGAWINYVLFCLMTGGEGSDKLKNVCDKAEKKLTSNLKNKFKKMYEDILLGKE